MTDMNDYFRLQTPNGEVKRIIDSNGQIIWRRAIEKETTELSFEGTRNTQLKTLEQYGLVTQPPKVYYDSLTQKGKCTQDGTPTSSAPVNIMCNNGELKWDSVNQRVYADGTSMNLYDPSKRTDNVEIEWIKTPHASTGMCYSAAIPVEQGKTYYYRLILGEKTPGVQAHRFIQIYDNDNEPSADNPAVNNPQFIIRNSNAIAGEPVRGTFSTNDSSVKFVRLSLCMNDSFIMFSEYDDLYYPYHNGELVIVESRAENLVNVGTNIPGYYISSSGGIGKDTNSQYTDLIPVTPGEGYVWTLMSNRQRDGEMNRLHGYDSSGNWVVQIAHKAVEAGTNIPCKNSAIIPSGISYVRLSYGIADVNVSFTNAQYQYATVPMLLSVGDVKDEVELIAGTYTHRCAACEYDGTQDVGDTYLSTTGGKDIGAIIVYPLATATTEQITAQYLTMNSNSEIIVVANVPDIETEIGHTERTPSPEYPLPLFCNNDELKWDGTEVVADGTPEVLTVSWQNLLNQATNITGKYLNVWGNINDGDDAQYTDLIPVTEGETYVCSLVSGRNYGTNRLHGYNASGGWVKQLSLVSASEQQGARLVMNVTIDSGISYVRLSYGITDTEAMIICANPYMLDFYETKSYSSTAYIGEITKIQSPYTGDNRPGLLFDVTPGTSYMIVDDCKRNNKKVIDGNVCVSCYRSIEDATNRGNALNKATGRLFTAPAEASLAVVNYNAGPGAEYSYTFNYAAIISSEYTPYAPPQTTSVPMLLSVGDVKDEVELISGIKTSKVGVKVLTSADISSFSDGCFFVNITDKLGGKTELLSTHFEYTTDSSSAISAGQMGSASDSSSTSVSTYYKISGVSTQAEAEAWVDEQFDLGTPVIVLYPLATETTESTTSQPIQQNIGYNFVNSSTSILGGYLVTYYGE